MRFINRIRNMNILTQRRYQTTRNQGLEELMRRFIWKKLTRYDFINIFLIPNNFSGIIIPHVVTTFNIIRGDAHS